MKQEFNLIIPNDEIKELDLLMFQLGLKTRRDLFNNALTLLFWAARQKMEGRIITSTDEKNNLYRELSMPALDSIKRKYS